MLYSRFEMLTASTWRRRTLALLLGASLIAACAPAFAADDEDEEAVDEKFIGSIMSGLGLRGPIGNGIDYRERSPLVVPPMRELPPPDANASVQNPAWPKDPEKQIKKVKRDARSATTSWDDSAKALTPQQLEQGRAAGAGRVTTPQADNNQFGRVSSPRELGYKGGVWESLFGYKEEAVPFTGEPGRQALTDPPTGYQTPSSAYPYGLTRDKNGTYTKIDRAVGQ